MQELQFNIRLRVKRQAVAPDHFQDLRCPACGALLQVHQPEPEFPHRLLASCTCEECGIWFSLIVTPDDKNFYLIRLPAIIELTEAIARLEDSHGSVQCRHDL